LQYLEVSHGGEEYGEANADRALKRNETSIKVSIEKLDAARKSPGSHLWDSVAYLYYANLNEAMMIPMARFLRTFRTGTGSVPGSSRCRLPWHAYGTSISSFSSIFSFFSFSNSIFILLDWR
jgi:hypothetical protein